MLNLFIALIFLGSNLFNTPILMEFKLRVEKVQFMFEVQFMFDSVLFISNLITIINLYKEIKKEKEP